MSKSKTETQQVDRKTKPGRKPGTPKTGGKPKGSPKTGGRKKGTPNKNTSSWGEILTLEGFIVPIEAMKLFKAKNTSASMKLQILQFLAPYCQAQYKPKEQDEEPTSKDKPEAKSASVLNIVKK